MRNNNFEIVNLNEDDQNYYSRLSKFLDENRKYFENNKQQFDVIDDLDFAICIFLDVNEKFGWQDIDLFRCDRCGRGAVVVLQFDQTCAPGQAVAGQGQD